MSSAWLLLVILVVMLWGRVGGWAVMGAVVVAALLVAGYALRRPDRRPSPPELVAEVRAVGPDLSTAELAVLKLLVTGAKARDIAADLELPEDEVREHIRSILGKLDVHRRLAEED